MPPSSQELSELLGLPHLPVWGWILPMNRAMVSEHDGLPFDHENPDGRHPALVTRDYWDPKVTDYCGVYPRSTKDYNRGKPFAVESSAHPDGHQEGCCINENGWLLTRDIHRVAAADVVQAADRRTGSAYRCTEPDASGLRTAIELPAPAF